MVLTIRLGASVTLLLACLMTTAAEAAPALPSADSCPVEPRPDWSPTEQWSWGLLCRGKIVDLNCVADAALCGAEVKSRPSKTWAASHKLGAEFLETILLHEPWRSSIPRQGVGIIGAWFDKGLDLENADFGHAVALAGSRFTGSLNLSRIHAKQGLSLEGSIIEGDLDLSDARIDGDLRLGGIDLIGNIDLSFARIEGSVDLSENANVAGELDADTTFVGADLFLDDGSQYRDVVLYDAHIGGWLHLSNSVVHCRLDMYSVSIDGNFYMIEAQLGGKLANRKSCEDPGDGWSFGVRLSQARIGGVFDMAGASVHSSLAMTFARIGAHFILADAELDSLDLTGSTIIGELRLAKDDTIPTWRNGASLVLRSTRVNSVVDQPTLSAWPKTLDLDGFVYQNFIPFVDSRGPTWFVQWLARDQPFSRQPYQQLSTFLRNGGFVDQADNILFRSKERERSELSSGVFDSIWMMLLKIFIGYGYRIHYCLYWFLAVIALGVVVLRVSGQGPAHRMPYGIAYSLDMLLPIIELRGYHHNIDLNGWARYYFYGHKMMGYVLASFLVAGLSGLAQ